TSASFGNIALNDSNIICDIFNTNISNNSGTIALDIFNNSSTISSDIFNDSDNNVSVSDTTINDFDNIISINSGSITYNKSKNNIRSDNNLEIMIYDLDKVYEIIAKKFEETEIFNDPIKFVLEVELDQDLLNEFSLDQQNLANTTNLKIIEI
ncbi:5244_t:CDS:1, partial [Dentiscutata heterogama]